MSDIFDEENKNSENSILNSDFDSSFVNDLFATTEYDKPEKEWTLDDIDRLLDELGRDSEMEQAGEDFDFDKYQEYKEPEEHNFGEIVKADGNEENYDENGIYFSKEYKKEIIRSEEKTAPTEFEDFYSGEELTEDTDSLFENENGEDLSSIDGNINALRDDGEFKEIDESLDLDGNVKIHSEDEDKDYDRDDYLKVKDIFKNSKILGKRKIDRAKIREEAIENIKNQYGEDIFDYQKKEADFDDILKRQAIVEKQKRRKKKKTERRFDIDSENYVSHIVATEEESQIRVDEIDKSTSENLDDFLSTRDINEENDEKTKTIFFNNSKKKSAQHTDMGNTRTKDIYISQNKVQATVDDSQILLEGYPIDEAIPDQVDEDEIQHQLQLARESRKIRFDAINIPENYDDCDSTYISKEKGKYDEEEYFELNDEDNPKSFASLLKGTINADAEKKMKEYTEVSERPQIFKNLFDRRKQTLLNLGFLFALEIILGITTLIMQNYGGSATVSGIILISISLVCILLTFVVGTSVTRSGFRSLSKKKIDVDSAVTIVLLVSAVDCISKFFDVSSVGESFPIYSFGIIFCVLLNCLGKYIRSVRAINVLKTCSNKRRNDLFVIESIKDIDDAEKIARILAGPNPDVKYSEKIKFPSQLISNVFTGNPSDYQQKKLFPILSVLSVIVAIITGLVNKNIIMGISTLTACLCISVCVPLFVSADLSLLLINKKLAKDKSCITGYGSVKNADKTNAVIVKATDLFDEEKCGFHGIKDFNNVRVDDVILYASAMLKESKGPLSKVFNTIIVGEEKELLPEVEDLFYEERLGLSGWIHGQKVLLGNRNLLITHSLNVPEKALESDLLKDGKRALYIAIDGKVAAMLVVGYSPDLSIVNYLKKLDRNGTTVIVSTNDCNIDEDSLSLMFNLPKELFKVVGDYEGGPVDGYTDCEQYSASAKLVHGKSFASFLKCLTTSISYCSSVKIMNMIQFVFSFIGLIVAAILAISGNLSGVGSGMIIAFHLINTAVSSVSGYIRSKI